jgi:hypothetical protein
MATLSQTNSKQGDVAGAKFIKFRVSEDLWERVHIAKTKARSSIEEICTAALVLYLKKEQRDAK